MSSYLCKPLTIWEFLHWFSLCSCAEAEAPILWPPDVKSQLIGKDPDAGKDWGQEKRVAEDKMGRWHQWLNGHDFEETVKDREAWCAAVHGLTKSQTWLNNWTTTTGFNFYHKHPLNAGWKDPLEVHAFCWFCGDLAPPTVIRVVHPLPRAWASVAAAGTASYGISYLWSWFLL